MSTPSFPDLWATCVDRLKDRINNRSFWEAVESTWAITIDNGILVIGLPPEYISRASLITQVSTLHTVNTVVQEVFRQPLRVQIIEGLTLQDWEAHKEREARMAAARQAVPAAPRPVTSAGGSWEMVYEQMARLFAQMPYRSLPQGKARYADQALNILVEAMDTLYPAEPDEQAERSLARVLERISNVSEIPAAMLAFELERLRAWRSSLPGAAP